MPPKPWYDTKHSRQRQPQSRPYNKRFLIVTEGDTEHAYFCHYKTRPALDMPTAVIDAVNPSVNKQLSLVKEVIRLRAERAKADKFEMELDEAWAVFDRDVDGHNPHDKDNFKQAIELADAKGILAAYSNDSFELWYLLHYQDVTAALHRRDLDKKLSGHLGRVYKSRSNGTLVEDLFYEIKAHRAEAIKRAKSLHVDHYGTHAEAANPCTTVYDLVERIISASNYREV